MDDNEQLLRQVAEDIERERDEWRQRRRCKQEARRRETFDAHDRYVEQTRQAVNKHMIYKSQMKDFNPATLWMTSSNIFAHPSASGDGKGYLHGRYLNLWNLCHRLGTNVCFDEMVPHD